MNKKGLSFTCLLSLLLAGCSFSNVSSSSSNSGSSTQISSSSSIYKGTSTSSSTDKNSVVSSTIVSSSTSSSSSSLSSSTSTNSSTSSSSTSSSSSSGNEEVVKTTLSKDVYDMLTSSLKLVNKTKYITAVAKNDALVEQSSFEESNVVIYEDVFEDEMLGSYETYNPTDRYENIFYNSAGKETDRYTYVLTTGKNVGQESINLKNEVISKPMIYDESETTKWMTSLYQNLFTAFYSEANKFTEANFETTDGIHYDLGKSWLIYGDMFFKSIFLDNGSSDRFGIEVRDGKPVAIYGSTYPSYSETANKYYYMEYRAEIVLDDVKTSRLQPYERQDYHDRIDAAINKALDKNYTAVVNMYGKRLTYKFTENMMTIEDNGSLVGYYPYNNGRAQFTLEDGKYVQSAVSEKSFDEVYPTFDIASEILTSTSNKNVFTSHDGLGAYAAYFAYGGLGDYITGNSTLELTDSNELKELNYTYSIDGDDGEVTVLYSNFGTTEIDIDVKDIVIPNAPVTWEDYSEEIYNRMIELFGDTYLPYVEAEKGWNVSTGINYMQNYGYYTFHTNNFSNTENRDAFMKTYAEALLANGFVLTGEKHEGYDLYSNGFIEVAITKASYGTKMTLVIFA